MQSLRTRFRGGLFLLVGLGLVLSGASLSAATYTVNSNLDTGAAGTLRWAIDLANANPGSTITLNNNLGTITLTDALPVISVALTINGGSGNTINGFDGVNGHRIFFVNTGSSTDAVNITNLSLTNGYAKGGDGGPAAGGGMGAGGALFISKGAVTVAGVSLTNNTAKGGNGGNGGARFSGTEAGGGGGLGGNGGMGDHFSGGGGGGYGGNGGNAGNLYGGGGGGIIGNGGDAAPAYAGGGGGYTNANGNTGGVNGGNGGRSDATPQFAQSGGFGGGGGGGRFSPPGTPAGPAGSGGVYGGGGGSSSNANGRGNPAGMGGDFGGGGGQAAYPDPGGTGGFGGGGGAGGSFTSPTAQNFATGGTGGFGGGGGGSSMNPGYSVTYDGYGGRGGGYSLSASFDSNTVSGGGGGGAALGGSVFVRSDNGASLTFSGIVDDGGVVAGSAGTSPPPDGRGWTLVPAAAGQTHGSAFFLSSGVNSFGEGMIEGSISGLTGASLVKVGTGTLVLQGTNDYTGGTVIQAGTLQLGNGGATGSILGNVTNHGSLVFQRSDDLTYSNIISGSGVLEQRGAGALTMTGSNSYTGGTLVKNGTLILTGSGAINHSGGYFRVGSASGDNGSLLINGGYVSSSNGAVGLSAGSTGNAEVSSGTWSSSILRVGQSGTGNLLINGGLVSDNSASIGAFSSSAVGIATVIGGTWSHGSEVIIGDAGTGTLNISGGLVSVDGFASSGIISTAHGTINLSGSGMLSTRGLAKYDGEAVINFNGGVLQARVNEANFITGYEAGDLRIQSGGVFIDSGSHAIGISTNLSGTGGMTKQGAGTLRLSGSSGYSGGTTVTSGTLAAANNHAVGTSTVLVEGGVFLIEQGVSVANSVTLSGGSLAQQVGAGSDLTTLKIFTDGVSGGITTVSQLLDGTTSAGATITSGFSATSSALNDEIRLSDVFHFSGVPVIGPGGATDMFVLQLSVSGLTADSYLGWLDTDTNTWINAVAGNIGGTATPFTRGYNPLTDFQLGYYGVDVGNGSVWAVVNHNSDFGVIPEPGTLALAGLGLGVLFLRRRRRTVGCG